MTPSQLWTLLELRQRPATSTRLAVASGVERNTAYQRVACLNLAISSSSTPTVAR